MESIESKLQQFQVAWQEFISNLANSDVFKNIIDSLTRLMDKINGGSTPVVLLGTAVGLLLKQLTKLDGPLNRILTKAGKSLSNIKKLTPANLKAAKSYLTIQKNINKYNQEINKSSK